MKKVSYARSAGILFLVTFILVYIFHPVVNSKINGIIFVLSNDHIGITAGYIGSFGKLSAPVSIVLMVFQSVLAPLSAKSIIIANTQLFGNFLGGFISVISITIGSVVCYALWILIFGWIPFPTKQMEVKRRQWEIPVLILSRILLFPFYDYCSFLLGFFKVRVMQYIIISMLISFLYISICY